MMKRFFLLMSLAWTGASQAPIALAQETSPTLLIESVPSDNPDYRRMIFVKYLMGDRVNVTYKTFTRSEFRQVPDATPQDIISECTNGTASSLTQIRQFEKDEAQRAKRGEAPENRRFCIKNISNWEPVNRDRYLDPIFNGLPLAPK